jgi:hypothetical protein
MKSIGLLRVLSLLGFLLLMAPFYDQCNGRGTKLKIAEEVEAPAINVSDSIPVQKTEVIEELQTNSDKESILVTAYECIDDEGTQNVYELAEFITLYYSMTYDEFTSELEEDLKEKRYDLISGCIRSIACLVIILSSLLVLVCSFLNRYKWMYNLTLVNLISLFILSICILFFDSLFETIRQFKWGYYLFLVVQLTQFIILRQSRLKIPN